METLHRFSTSKFLMDDEKEKSMSAQTVAAAAPVTLKDLKAFFGYDKLTDFSKDWKELSEESRKQIKDGINDGTFNY